MTFIKRILPLVLNNRHHLLLFFTFSYFLLLAYGSLYPLTDWKWPETENWIASFESKTRYVPRSDIIINTFIYIPFGILISILLEKRINRKILIISATLIAAIVSLILESIQLFIPSRAHSFIDFYINTLGAFSGAFLYFFTSKASKLGAQLHQLRKNFFKAGRLTDLGLLVCIAWALAEISIIAPYISFNNFPTDANLANHSALATNHLASFSGIAFMLKVFAVMVLFSCTMRDRSNAILLSFLFISITLFLKTNLANMELPNEQLTGFLVGAAIFFVLQEKSQEYLLFCAIYALLFAYIINELNYPGITNNELATTFNWIPFTNESKRIFRLTEFLNITWIFLGLSYFINFFQGSKTVFIFLSGFISISVLCITMEWQQQWLDGANADISDIIVAIIAWSIPFAHPYIRQSKIDKAILKSTVNNKSSG